jgi:hypothetical protein
MVVLSLWASGSNVIVAGVTRSSRRSTAAPAHKARFRDAALLALALIRARHQVDGHMG